MNPKDEIKERLPILDVVSTYVRLEKSGNQYKARCPFHNERTASFYVSPERKTFHCFGCGQHGDIFTFIERLENIPFYEALKLLADRAGVKLTPNKDGQKETRLIALLKDTTHFFEKSFAESAEAQHYVYEDRGIERLTRDKFHIGFARNEWRALFIYLSSLGYMPEEMEAAGVAIKTEKGYYDRFRGRVMFPIRNISGATVGFSGRILPSLADPTKEQAKYVNTPETVLYHKSKILFGYDTAKKQMHETKVCVVVEGQMDLVMSFQAGIENTIAVSGTAFTDEHIALIKRFADKIIFSFDTDNAGQSALKKSAMMALLGGLDVHVTADIGTKDPADLVRENKDLWVKAVAHPQHVIIYFLKHIMATSSDERERGRRVVSELIPYVRAIQSSVDRVYFIKQIAKETGLTEDSLQEEVRHGGTMMRDVESSETREVPPMKEKIERELIALVTWKNFKDHEKVTALSLPYDAYPSEIVEETIFELEAKLRVPPEKLLEELVISYTRELYRGKLQTLNEKLRGNPEDEDTILKEIDTISRLHKKA